MASLSHSKGSTTPSPIIRLQFQAIFRVSKALKINYRSQSSRRIFYQSLHSDKYKLIGYDRTKRRKNDDGVGKSFLEPVVL